MSSRPPTSAQTPQPTKMSMLEFAALKRRGEKITMVTAYDAPSGRLADLAGVDCILVGDSAAMTVLGRESTSRRRWTRCSCSRVPSFEARAAQS
jgi:3-methyl-2-oxobutanoate hydroxymethyltransferase